MIRSCDLNNQQWDSYAKSFNEVFNKNFPQTYFTNKYLNTIDGFSSHVLLIENNEIYGGCTAIPYNYLVGNERLKIGLVVDVFILSSSNSDPFTLLKMYTLIKARLQEVGISMIIAVPNDLIYSYWKNIVKWKDIGLISYYAYPVRLANVIKTASKILNIICLCVEKINWGLNKLISVFLNPTQMGLPISIDRSSPVIEEQRYNSDHYQITNDLHSFAYRIMQENQVQTAYLIDFYNNKKGEKDLRTLLAAFKYILKNHRIDILIFVGKLNFFQTLLLRIPKKYEPKKLRLMCDFIKPIEKSRAQFILDHKNWDFGLFNFDVR